MVLASLPQANGIPKPRPVLLLRELPPFGDFLVCGISTQLGKAVPAFDEVIVRGDADFRSSGLVADSVVRLGFLAVLPRQSVMGSIGVVEPSRHARLLRNLSRHLLANVGNK